MNIRPQSVVNEVGFDINLQSYKEKPMTLVVAVAGKSEVILASESLCQLGDGDGQYNVSTSKIRLMGDVAFGFAAGRSGFGLFSAVGKRTPFRDDESLHEGITRFIAAMGREYKDNRYDDTVRFLVCGVDDKEPLIYVGNFMDGVVAGPAHISEGRIAIGIEKHGALHFLHRYHHRNMTTNELAFLAYFSISETIFHDGRVKKPIDVFIVREGLAKPLEREQILQLENASQESADAIGEVLVKAAPDLKT